MVSIGNCVYLIIRDRYGRSVWNIQNLHDKESPESLELDKEMLQSPINPKVYGPAYGDDEYGALVSFLDQSKQKSALFNVAKQQASKGKKVKKKRDWRKKTDFCFGYTENDCLSARKYHYNHSIAIVPPKVVEFLELSQNQNCKTFLSRILINNLGLLPLTYLSSTSNTTNAAGISSTTTATATTSATTAATTATATATTTTVSSSSLSSSQSLPKSSSGTNLSSLSSSASIQPSHASVIEQEMTTIATAGNILMKNNSIVMFNTEFLQFSTQKTVVTNQPTIQLLPQEEPTLSLIKQLDRQSK
jgi:hypothetical protein